MKQVNLIKQTVKPKQDLYDRNRMSEDRITIMENTEEGITVLDCQDSTSCGVELYHNFAQKLNILFVHTT